MAWWYNLVQYWKWAKSRNGNGNGGSMSVRLAVYSAVFESTVDFIFYIIGIYTWIYFLSFVYLFFIDQSFHHDTYVKIVDALTEPYLGAVGIYAILKEIRKRRGVPSRHFGEFFVFSWLALMLGALGAVIFSSAFYFNDLMSDIITIGLALLVIYIGGIIHKP